MCRGEGYAIDVQGYAVNYALDDQHVVREPSRPLGIAVAVTPNPANAQLYRLIGL
jgi:hypothetical protein